MLPRELHKHLVGTRIAAPVVLVGPFDFTESGDVDITIALFRAPRKMRFVSGAYTQSVDAQAATSYTATIEVGSQQLSQDLDILTLGAAAVGYFALSVTSSDRDIAKGSLVEVNFNETGGTVTSPEIVHMTLEFQLLE